MLDEALLKNASVDCSLSLNHNNNHVDSLPQHTYATHKLPNFIEIMSSQKRHSSQSSNPDPVQTIIPMSTPNIDTVQSVNATELNGTYDESDEQSQHAIDLSTTSLIIHDPKSNEESNAVATVNHTNESSIGQYIAKNPNLTFKGSGDIMNMDIIFENVSIEEDVTIGGTEMTTESNVKSTVPLVTTMTESQSDNLVKIDGVQYEIITVENANDKQCDDDDESTVKVVTDDDTEIVEEVNESTIPVIDQCSYEDENYMYTSSPNDMVIMTCSSLDVAAEIETVDEKNGEAVDLSSSSICLESSNHSIELPDSNAAMDLSGAATVDTEDKAPVCDSSATITESNEFKPKESAIKDEITQSAAIVKNTETDRKRKRKVVPVLMANNKRTRRSAVKINTETKSKDVPSDKQSDSRVENQMSPRSPTPSRSPSPPNQFEQSSIDQMDIKPDEQQLATAADEQNIVESDHQIKDDDDDDDNNSDRNFMDSLVVVESQDPNDSNRTIYEVYVVDPDTNEMSEKPLDLPDHVIQRIRLSMS